MYIEKVVAGSTGHYMLIRCDCGVEIKHHMPDWRVLCPICTASIPIGEVASSPPKEDKLIGMSLC